MNDRRSISRRYEQGLRLEDLDVFADLEWEREVQQRSAQSARRKPATLTARIEDYLRSY